MHPATLGRLPPLGDQVDRLLELGVAQRADLSEADLRTVAALDVPDALLVVSSDRAAASELAPLLVHGGRPGFVVSDMTDVDEFAAIPEVGAPPGALYLLTGIDRGDDLANWSPQEALPEILAAGRTPLTIGEGIQWLLHQPTALERNRCFMTIGSRLRRPTGGLDARTPAIWISNGTGRDGAAHRNAPKVGWCWAGNRHTWLGFASASGRQNLQ